MEIINSTPSSELNEHWRLSRQVKCLLCVAKQQYNITIRFQGLLDELGSSKQKTYVQTIQVVRLSGILSQNARPPNISRLPFTVPANACRMSNSRLVCGGIEYM